MNFILGDYPNGHREWVRVRGDDGEMGDIICLDLGVDIEYTVIQDEGHQIMLDRPLEMSVPHGTSFEVRGSWR